MSLEMMPNILRRREFIIGIAAIPIVGLQSNKANAGILDSVSKMAVDGFFVPVAQYSVKAALDFLGENVSVEDETDTIKFHHKNSNREVEIRSYRRLNDCDDSEYSQSVIGYICGCDKTAYIAYKIKNGEKTGYIQPSHLQAHAFHLGVQSLLKQPELASRNDFDKLDSLLPTNDGTPDNFNDRIRKYDTARGHVITAVADNGDGKIIACIDGKNHAAEFKVQKAG